MSANDNRYIYIKILLGNFGEKVIWYVGTYVEHISSTLTLTSEGFKTLIVVRNSNPKYYSPPG